MKTKIALVTCVKEKQAVACEAQSLYQGDLFAKWMDHAANHADTTYILSGKHHLLQLTDVIAPYDVNLNHVSDAALREWSETVISQLSSLHDLSKSHFIVMTNPIYYKYLLAHFTSHEIPFEIE